MGGRYGSGNGMGGGVRRAVSAGGGGGEGLDENSRELANKYEDVSSVRAVLFWHSGSLRDGVSCFCVLCVFFFFFLSYSKDGATTRTSWRDEGTV